MFSKENWQVGLKQLLLFPIGLLVTGCASTVFCGQLDSTDCSSFWQAIAAITTALAVIVALFQEKLRAYWLEPDLDLRLRDPNGHFVKTITDTGTSNALFYHLELLNRTKNIAIRPGIYIVGHRDEAGRPKKIAPLRLGWAHEDAHRSTSLGPETEFPEWNFCDLLVINRGSNIVALRTVFTATEFNTNLPPGSTINIFVRIFAQNYIKRHVWEIKIIWEGPSQPFSQEHLATKLRVQVERCDETVEDVFSPSLVS